MTDGESHMDSALGGWQKIKLGFGVWMRVLQRAGAAALALALVATNGTAFAKTVHTGVHSGITKSVSRAATRRARIAAAAREAAANAGAAAASAGAQVASISEDFRLKLHNLHTGESLDIVYRVGDTYLPEAVEKLNYLLRDRHTQDATSYDPKEFDVLHGLLARLRKPNGVIDIVCGYRTPETNADLRQNSPQTGVAEHSQHMEGHAIDIRVPGVSTVALRNAALSLHAGGVGYYPSSQFVHVDVGPVRQWAFGKKPRKPGRHRSKAASHVSTGM